MPSGRYLYPVFEDEKSSGSDQKIGQAKNCIKRPIGLIKLLQGWFESNLKKSPPDTLFGRTFCVCPISSCGFSALITMFFLED